MNKYILDQNGSVIHFIGIGGISTSALAKYLLKENYIVTGSDVEENEQTEKLKSLGATINIGHAAENVLGSDAVVYTSAISADNPEFLKAKSLNLPCVKRSELLGEIAKRYKNSIAVSGSHGKTTATGMISQILYTAQTNPTVFIGGEHLDFDNFKNGDGDTIVLEACEYKKNFLDITPTVSVVLNVDDDHMDCYENMSNVVEAFRKFASGSITVLNADDKNSQKIFNATTVTFGIKNKATYTADKIKYNGKGYSFTVRAYGRIMGRINLSVIGEHNIYNALSAVAVADILHIRFPFIKSGLEGFKGIKRRNEFLGEKDDLNYYADYAHHPKEILATLKAFNNGGTKNVVVFQPHTYSRTRILMEEFVDVFKKVEPLIIYKTYPARETFDIDGDAFTLYQRLKDQVKNVYYADNEKQLMRLIEKNKKGYNNIIFLGAGDIYKTAKGQIN